MHAWIVTVGEPLPVDGCHPRLLRSGMLAEHLAGAGHPVTFVSSAFNHSEKRFRASETTTISVGDRYSLVLLQARGYRKNVSVARVRDHRHVAREFRRWAGSLLPADMPDVIVASLPTVEVARAATELGRNRAIPVIVDIRDMWPDVASFAAPAWARPAVAALTAPMARQARDACEAAAGLISHTDEFLEWGLARAGRPRDQRDGVFPFGYIDSDPDSAALQEASAFWDSAGIQAKDKVICFAGSISHQLDPEPVLTAARRLRHLRYQFVFCGDGDRLTELRKLAADLENVLFAGWVDRAVLRELMNRSSVGLLCARGTPDFLASVPNKVAEYLASSLPVAVPYDHGPVVRIIRARGCGILYGNDGDMLANQLQRLCDDPAKLQRAKQAARLVYDENFRADEIYRRLVAFLMTACASGVSASQQPGH